MEGVSVLVKVFEADSEAEGVREGEMELVPVLDGESELDAVIEDVCV
jgi:hypothetical protein